MHLLAQNFNFQYFEFIIFHGLGLNEILSNSKDNSMEKVTF